MGDSPPQDPIIEVEVLSVPGTEDWVAEVWDLTPGGRGEMMHVHKRHDGDLTLDLLGQVLPVELVQRSLNAALEELTRY